MRGAKQFSDGFVPLLPPPTRSQRRWRRRPTQKLRADIAAGESRTNPELAPAASRQRCQVVFFLRRRDRKSKRHIPHLSDMGRSA